MTRLFLLFVLALSVGAVFAQPQEDAPMNAYTYQDASGNRLVAGSGTFPDVHTADLKLDGVPLWIVGGAVGDSAAWLVALEDGRVLAAQPSAGVDGVSGMAFELAQLPAGAPIAAAFPSMGLPVLLPVGADLSPLSHAVALDATTTAYISANGDLVLWRDDAERARVAVNALPDARPVLSASGQIAVYSGATDARYVHGVLGDTLEAATLHIFARESDALNPIAQVTLDGQDVFEGVSPLWADLDGDGTQELVTTVSNGDVGAQVRLYSAAGELIASSTPIGLGGRWRHQLAVGAFGINGETQLVDVLTPHIGGMVEFFDLDGARLVVNNAQLGYTSHRIGSFNLDMALAGDFDGDGKPELVLTDQDGGRIVGVVNTLSGVQEAWSLALDGTRLSSNLSAVTLADGRLALAAGTEGGLLRVWLPR